MDFFNEKMGSYRVNAKTPCEPPKTFQIFSIRCAPKESVEIPTLPCAMFPRTMNESQHAPDPSARGPRDMEMLHPEVYQELRAIASARMAGQPSDHTMQPTVLVHEAWLRMAGRDHEWRDRSHFVAVAATAMRHILIDHARKKSRVRHGGGQLRMDTGSFQSIAAPDQNEQVLLIDEAITEMEKVDPVRAQVVVARFFGGLSNLEIAENLAIGERSVERHWAIAKVWLLRWMRENSDI
jgi:RNA polymerase sigma factor (TIGR02999 family)